VLDSCGVCGGTSYCAAEVTVMLAPPSPTASPTLGLPLPDRAEGLPLPDRAEGLPDRGEGMGWISVWSPPLSDVQIAGILGVDKGMVVSVSVSTTTVRRRQLAPGTASRENKGAAYHSGAGRAAVTVAIGASGAHLGVGQSEASVDRDGEPEGVRAAPRGMTVRCGVPVAGTHRVPSGFLVVFEKPNRSSFTFTTKPQVKLSLFLYAPSPFPLPFPQEVTILTFQVAPNASMPSEVLISALSTGLGPSRFLLPIVERAPGGTLCLCDHRAAVRC